MAKCSPAKVHWNWVISDLFCALRLAQPVRLLTSSLQKKFCNWKVPCSPFKLMNILFQQHVDFFRAVNSTLITFPSLSASTHVRLTLFLSGEFFVILQATWINLINFLSITSLYEHHVGLACTAELQVNGRRCKSFCYRMQSRERHLTDAAMCEISRTRWVLRALTDVRVKARKTSSRAASQSNFTKPRLPQMASLNLNGFTS